ncbi:Molybdopterin molybdenumtransferase [Pontiella desulfatans]|uniref:Molybdopterin molybdenumtransferase n=1 Tax=Pontiella desulfatans TaxID=2750659 RepID=A0A6C2U5X8_PONDE|nr:gephyrin-like molybdotransferase Glp [Pontiella desulfatans]VGO15482.1 Molybdopterin molybdenumtransferase [Pontiella desulfatans]
MITFDEAYAIVMDNCLALGSETVPLEQSLGRVLAEPVLSDIDMPPFNKSAMDGYACRRADIRNELTVVEELPAGVAPTKTIGANECAKIMTGSMVPQGADCVIMVEDTVEVSATTIRYTEEETKTNICTRGEDIRAGDEVLAKGAVIQPQHIAVLATVGCTQPRVAKQPRVGIISTGSELVEPSEKATGAKIRNSNGWQLAAQVEQMGCLATNMGIAVDDEEALAAAIGKAMAENDVVMLSGGVSMGDYDLVPGILKNNGIELLFTSVAIKPGRPSTFGVGEQVRVFALPGNPVATYMQFEALVKPFLFNMMGHAFRPRHVCAKLNRDLRLKPAKRSAIIPIRFTAPDRVEPIEYHGSAHINALCSADGFLLCPSEGSSFKQDEEVDVRLF